MSYASIRLVIPLYRRTKRPVKARLRLGRENRPVHIDIDPGAVNLPLRLIAGTYHFLSSGKLGQLLANRVVEGDMRGNAAAEEGMVRRRPFGSVDILIQYNVLYSNY